jgi:hypothetical protein
LPRKDGHAASRLSIIASMYDGWDDLTRFESRSGASLRPKEFKICKNDYSNHRKHVWWLRRFDEIWIQIQSDSLCPRKFKKFKMTIAIIASVYGYLWCFDEIWIQIRRDSLCPRKFKKFKMTIVAIIASMYGYLWCFNVIWIQIRSESLSQRAQDFQNDYGNHREHVWLFMILWCDLNPDLER